MPSRRATPAPPQPCAPRPSRCRAARSDDELSPDQLAAMDSLWRARRDGIDARDGDEVEVMIRTGRVSAGRKRLTEARRRARESRP